MQVRYSRPVMIDFVLFRTTVRPPSARLAVLAALISLAAACTKPNRDACCTSTDDCKAFGLDSVQPCDNGLTCVGHQCVAPQCSTQGCGATAPVCDTTTDTCAGCDDAADCSRFAGTDVCDTATGACVECVGPSDCSSDKPICETSVCRGCKLDSECASGACGDDGACVPEASIVYMSPASANTGTCTRSAPCSGLQYAVRATTTARQHIVMQTGSYLSDRLTVGITSAETAATKLTVHGANSTFTSDGCGEPLLGVTLATVMRDLTLTCQSSTAIGGRNLTLERIHIDASTGVNVSGPVVLRDVSIKVARAAVNLEDGAALTADRVTILGGQNGIAAVGTAPTSVDITNLLVSNTSDLALDLRLSSGTLSFATIVTSAVTPDATAGLKCPPTFMSQLATRSTIVWTSSQRQPASGTCNFVSAIAGPNGVAGAMNVDPRFVDFAGGDYHLTAASPARDAVDAGPAMDFEGDRRPRGARFDIGADEAP
jgi:hypothetical protein